MITASVDGNLTHDSPSAESRKFGFMAHLRGTAEISYLNLRLLSIIKMYDSKNRTVAYTLLINF